MSSILELTEVQRWVLIYLSLWTLSLVFLLNLKNVVWMFFTGRWFQGKPIRFVGSFASLGLFAVMWKSVDFAAVAVLLLGVAVTDGAVLLAEARQRKSPA